MGNDLRERLAALVADWKFRADTPISPEGNTYGDGVIDTLGDCAFELGNALASLDPPAPLYCPIHQHMSAERDARARLRKLEKDRPASLCDPECEGRCRVCPADWADSLITELRAALDPPAPPKDSARGNSRELKAAEDYVKCQLAIMQEYGSAPKLTASAFSALVQQVANAAKYQITREK